MTTAREMTGFLNTMTPEQIGKALAYEGDDTWPSLTPDPRQVAYEAKRRAWVEANGMAVNKIGRGKKTW